MCYVTDGGADSESEESEGEDHIESEESSGDEDQPEDDAGQDPWTAASGAVWSRQPVQRMRQHQRQNILREESGPTRQALQQGCGESPMNAFKIFINNEIVDILVRRTNEEARRRAEQWKNTNSDEIYTFLGLLILAGVYRGKQEPIKQLWNKVEGRAIFGKSMSRDRFIAIRKYLRFDDRETRAERRGQDKLAPIRQVIEIFTTKCKSSYKVGQNVTVDEQLVTFRGRCPFKVYVPNKPGKYGIKIWVCADSENSYCCNLQVYTGKVGNQPEVGQGARVVLELTQNLSDSGRHITADNFFTSVVLARSLLGRNLTYTGTIRKNKRDIPAAIKMSRDRAVFSSVFGYQQNMTLVSYVPKPNKAVLLLSTAHYDGRCDEAEPYKPEIILDYNRGKGGVDTLDHMIRTYSCKRKTRRWPFALFCNMVDIAACNAYVLFRILHPQFGNRSTHRRRVFIMTLAKQLLPQAVDDEQAVMAAAPVRVLRDEGPPSRRRCHLCPRQRERKSKQRCSRCGKNACGEHASIICESCA